MTKNPYAAALGAADPLKALSTTPRRIKALTSKWTARQWHRSYAPGKWSARQILVHLAHAWLSLDAADGPTALDTYMALRRFNLAMFKGLTPALRTRPFTHPEYGPLTPDWVMAQLAGHELHHLNQLKQI
jgi:hypothetical protein